MILRISSLTLFMLILFLLSACDRPEPNVTSGQIYDSATIAKPLELDFEVRETSGLLFYGEELWTVNDSKNKGVIYRIDPITGNLLDQVDLHTDNTDWEDLAIDSTYFYVADVGNNLGARQQLSIYRFPLAMLDGSEAQAADTIAFSFPDQKSFPGTYSHNFDAEAIVVSKEAIYLFSKNWENKECKLYLIPNTPGVHDAKKISSFNTMGLITAASKDPITSYIYLLGYNYDGANTPFIWKLSDYTTGDYFSGTKERFDIDLNRQTEALAVSDDGTIFISAEQSKAPAPGLWQISLDGDKTQSQ